MQGIGALRPHGMAEAMTAFARPIRVAVIGNASNAAEWTKGIARNICGAQVSTLLQTDALPNGVDVLVLDGDTLGPQTTIGLTARAMRAPGSPEVLIAANTLTGSVIAQALDIGASGVLRQPLHMTETTARISLLHRRRQRLAQLRDNLRLGLQSAMTDPLTGLFNRRYALPRVEALMSEVRACGQPAALLMCDLDHFKKINDTFGHGAGDKVLQNVATLMQDHTADAGFAARIGGEEFLIALPASSRLAAASFARKLRATIGGLITPYPAAPEGLNVTVSIGVATADPDTALPGDPAKAAADLLWRADRALYRAKAAGRNCVMQDLHLKSSALQAPRRKGAGRMQRGQLAG
jgi:two-component system cell cycle response regulator